MNGKTQLVLYSGLAVASSVSTVGVYGQINQSRAVPAFSYDVQFYRYDEEGVKQYTHTDHRGIRGDGSTVFVDNSSLANAGERRVNVQDFAKREAWNTSLIGRTVTTLPMVKGAVPAVHQEQCDEGEASRFGRYEVRKTRHIARNEETGAVYFIIDRWLAPELGCVALRTIRYGKDELPTHERVAANIVIGETDPTLFHVPDGYVESSPMQAQQKRVDLGTAAPFRDELGALDRAERKYWTTR